MKKQSNFSKNIKKKKFNKIKIRTKANKKVIKNLICGKEKVTTKV